MPASVCDGASAVGAQKMGGPDAVTQVAVVIEDHRVNAALTLVEIDQFMVKAEGVTVWAAGGALRSPGPCPHCAKDG